VLLVFRTHGHIEVDELRELADRDESDPDRLDRPEGVDLPRAGVES
jgi:hypothetical protein